MTLSKLNRATAGVAQTRPVKILQFGEGNFLRAFADWIIDMMNERTGFNGAIHIVQPIPQGMGGMVNEQEGLYHVVLNGIRDGLPSRETRLITSVAGVVNPFEDYQEFLRLGENPDLKFVLSNTTEAGIIFSGSDASPDTLPGTFPGKLTVLLHHRYRFFSGAADKALIIMPCELIDKNGDALRNAILQYVAHWNLPEGFRDWISNHTVFCNTLVDRIVPGFPRDNIADIHQSTGYDDKLVVMAESFHLWVIEGTGLNKVFPADAAGLQVKFVNDMTPYRTRKVRILNGAHTALVPVAYLHGLRTVKDAVEDAYTGDFITKAIEEEIIPTLDLSADELRQFGRDVIERFRNPFIRHELMSIALNSVSKYKVRVLPSLLQYVALKKQLPPRLVLSLAALIRFYKGSWGSEIIDLNDTADVLDFFRQVWQQTSLETVAHQTLSNVSFWDQDLTQVPGLTQAVVEHLSRMEKKGAVADR
ncbi:MAG TPA: tagaturonate reductase [Ohtaekwangia sp.]|nr:tagaturonate reductase [Ohtaekwangia sp.]